MRKLTVFDNVSLDGYFTDAHADMTWAHRFDPEWASFSADNASGDGELLFGRVTYEMMLGFWPTAQAAKTMPVVAERMNNGRKVVFSRTLSEATWKNTRLLKGDLIAEVRKLKAEPGPGLVVLGSGSIAQQLAEARLVDKYQLVICPIALGAGRTLFQGLREKLELKLEKTRAFGNGNVVLWYAAA
jgi:dihydrofolate reductase